MGASRTTRLLFYRDDAGFAQREKAEDFYNQVSSLVYDTTHYNLNRERVLSIELTVVSEPGVPENELTLMGQLEGADDEALS